MNTSLYIPSTLKVGYQKRSDTYSGKLAYVTYIDDKKKHRKFKSWDGWCQKEGREDMENEPMSGFVLNRDVGGTKRSWGSWDARIEKVRVYDPRGFEIEISIPNLLFVMTECSSIKGKGLEGEFVYSWSGPELVLLPVGSQEYKESSKFTKLQGKKVAMNDLKEGHLYQTKDKQNLLFLGRHNWYESDKWSKQTYYPNGLVFFEMDKKRYGEPGLVCHPNPSKLAMQVSDEPHPDFAEKYLLLEKSGRIRTPVEIFLKGHELEDNRYDGHFAVEHEGEIWVGKYDRNRYYYSSKPDFTYTLFAVMTLDKNGKVKYDHRPTLNLDTIAKLSGVPTKMLMKQAWIKFKEDGFSDEKIKFDYNLKPKLSKASA